MIRHAIPEDLDAINGVVERAVMSWDLPDRVKRLSLPTYRYHAYDFDSMHFIVEAGHGIEGVAAWEDAAAADLPGDASGVLLHGLYVDPGRQGGGIGRRLFAAVEAEAVKRRYGGILVKAQADATGFFERLGMALQPVVDRRRDYAGRYWKALG